MFEQLMNLVKQQSQDAVINNPDIPNEQNEEVMQTAGSSIMSTLQNMIGGGGSGAANVLNLFNQNNSDGISNHPVTQNVSSNLISSLMSKFGLSGDKAGGIASMIIPMVMSKLVSKTNDQNDSSFNLQGIFNSLSGGKTGGMDIGSLVSQFGGNALDKNHDGHVNLADLTAAFTGGGNNQNTQNNSQQQQSGGGGIMDTISGLFGK
jgi:Ca2+-binding EF-hand superfamily protein